MHETCGTPEYIAPEILLRVPYTGKKQMALINFVAPESYCKCM